MGRHSPPRRRACSFAAVLVASASALALQANTPATAQTAEAPATRDYDIPAQPLSSALTEFARQSDVRVLYAYNDLAGRQSPPVRGAYRPDDALQLLLQGSGLRARVDSSGAVRLEAPPRPQRANAEQGAASSEPARADTDAEVIVVTGTSIRGAHPAGANLVVVDRETIEETGRTSVAGLLQTFPQVSSVAQNDMTQLSSPLTASNMAFGSAVNMRGLGADATLTLLNGRRMAAAAAGNFVDVSGIPLAAVERVEVLADGASATYGTDAVAGVVNVILRRDFSGMETRLRYGDSTQGGGEDLGISQMLGGAWARGSLVGAYEYRQRGPLAKADRRASASSDLRPLGGSDYSSTFANPGNITRVGTTNVTLAIPEGQNGASLDQSELLPGVVNLHNENTDAFLMPRQEVHSLFLSGRFEASEHLELFFDALGAIRYADMRDVQLATTLAVPETNAYRQLNNLFPGGGPMRIQYSFSDDLGPIRYATESREHSVVAGLGYTFGRAWRAEASVAHSAHVDEVAFYNVIDTQALPAPLASSDLATAFNPFADGSNTDPSVLRGLLRRQDAANDSTMAIYSLRADGPLFELPGGPLRAALGVERRDEAFSIRRIGTRASGATEILPTQRPGSRITDAVYGEVLAPLFDTVSLSLSVRHETSSDYGDTTNPKVGVSWRPAPDLRFHATWGTSFKAPLFLQLLTATNSSYATNSAAFDPFATNGSTGTLTITGGNPSLGPERSESWTAGFDYAPRWLRGFSFDATYFDIDFADRVSTPGSAINALRSPVSFGGYFIRNPTAAEIAAALALDSDGIVTGTLPADGVEVIFDARQVNLASQRVRGVDIQARYELETRSLGDFTLSLSATDLLEHQSRPNQLSPTINALDTIFNQVDWRGRAGVAWRGDPWRANVSANYVDDYKNTLPLIPEPIDAWLTFDARLAYEWRQEDAISATQISLSIQNLADEDPPFVDNPVGIAFDSLNASPLGRFVSIELARRW